MKTETVEEFLTRTGKKLETQKAGMSPQKQSSWTMAALNQRKIARKAKRNSHAEAPPCASLSAPPELPGPPASPTVV